MAERCLLTFIKALVGKQVTVWTLGGEKHKGVLLDAGEDYLIVQREQMTPLVIPLSALDAISG